MNAPRRGEVRRAVPRGQNFVIVSNDRRNRNLKTVLGCRIADGEYPGQPTVVALPEDEGIAGSVVCDDVTLLRQGELADPKTVLSPATMAAVSAGLCLALDLNPTG